MAVTSLIQRDTLTLPNAVIVYDSRTLSTPSSELFQADYWGDRAVEHHEGRGAVWFLTHGESEWVLKTYRRGGQVARWLADQYLFFGYASTRMIREFDLLHRMVNAGLPVPRPVAACVTRLNGCLYRGHLISTRLSGTQSLSVKLSQGSLTSAVWKRVGETIARFHSEGVFHHDLNASNILIGDADVYVIDFDKCRFLARGHGYRWQAANVARLKRSLERVAEPGTMTGDDWQTFCQGYHHTLEGS